MPVRVSSAPPILIISGDRISIGSVHTHAQETSAGEWRLIASTNLEQWACVMWDKGVCVGGREEVRGQGVWGYVACKGLHSNLKTTTTPPTTTPPTTTTIPPTTPPTTADPNLARESLERTSISC